MLQTIWVCKNSSLEGTFCLPLLWWEHLRSSLQCCGLPQGGAAPHQVRLQCTFLSLLPHHIAAAASFCHSPLLLLRLDAHNKSSLQEPSLRARRCWIWNRRESAPRDKEAGSFRSTANNVGVVREREREGGESARARVFYLYFGGEWRRMSRVRARLLRYPLSVSGHRLNFTCMNDLQLWPKRAFPWRSGASFPLWDVNVARICQDKEVRHNYPLKNVDDAECAGAFCCSWRGRASHKAKHIWPLF